MPVSNRSIQEGEAELSYLVRRVNAEVRRAAESEALDAPPPPPRPRRRPGTGSPGPGGTTVQVRQNERNQIQRGVRPGQDPRRRGRL